MKKPRKAVLEGFHPERTRAIMQRILEGRGSERKKTRTAQRLARQLLAHEPLTKLDSDQKRLLREIMEFEVGRLREQDQSLSSPEASAAFRAADEFLSEQAEEGEEKVIEVLDIGTDKNLLLKKLKGKHPHIVTHGTTARIGTVRADVQHFLLAEALPKSFAERFRLITSDFTFLYTTFPDLALRNTVKALAPKGKAVLHIKPIGVGFLHASNATHERYYHEELVEKIKQYYEGRKRNRLTPTELERVKGRLRDPAYFLTEIGKSLEVQKYRHMIAKAFFRELGELRKLEAERKIKLEFFNLDGRPIRPPENIFELDDVMYLHITRLD